MTPETAWLTALRDTLHHGAAPTLSHLDGGEPTDPTVVASTLAAAGLLAGAPDADDAERALLIELTAAARAFGAEAVVEPLAPPERVSQAADPDEALARVEALALTAGLAHLLALPAHHPFLAPLDEATLPLGELPFAGEVVRVADLLREALGHLPADHPARGVLDGFVGAVVAELTPWSSARYRALALERLPWLAGGVSAFVRRLRSEVRSWLEVPLAPALAAADEGAPTISRVLTLLREGEGDGERELALAEVDGRRLLVWSGERPPTAVLLGGEALRAANTRIPDTQGWVFTPPGDGEPTLTLRWADDERVLRLDD